MAERYHRIVEYRPGLDERPTSLFLVRHGEIEGAGEGRLMGHTDVPLTERGLWAMEALGKRIRCALEADGFAGPLRPEALYSSPLARCRESTKALGRTLFGKRSKPPQVIEAFKEISIGRWEGMLYQEVARRFPKQLRRRLRDMVGVRPPGGESLLDLEARVMPALEELLSRHRGEALLVVGHAAVNRLILCRALGLGLSHFFRVSQDFGALNIINYYSDLSVVRLLNG